MSGYLDSLAGVDDAEKQKPYKLPFNLAILLATVTSISLLAFGASQLLPRVGEGTLEPDKPLVKSSSCQSEIVNAAEFFIIDASDEVADSQLTYVEAIVQEMTKEVVPGKRIYLYRLTDQSDAPLQLLGSVCDQRLDSLMKENGAARKRKIRELRQEVNAIIKSAFGGELPYSPVVEGLLELTRRLEFTGGLVAREDLSRRLWILSDGLQNSRRASVYRSKITPQQYQQEFGTLEFLNAQIVFTRIRRDHLNQSDASKALVSYLEQHTSRVQEYSL